MKKIFIAGIILVAVIFMGNDVHALTVGDEIRIGESYTAEPFSKFQLAGVMELVLDRDLEPDTKGTQTINFDGKRFLCRATMSVFQGLDIYAKGGLGQDKVEDQNNDLNIDSELGVSYGGGLRAKLIDLEKIGMYLGMDAQFLRLDTGIDTVNISSTNYTSVSGDFTTDQWQVALFIVKEFFQSTFYAGGQYSDSILKYDYDIDGATGNNKGRNDTVIGALGGINLFITDTVIFFLEGHFLDETSLSVGLNARF